MRARFLRVGALCLVSGAVAWAGLRSRAPGPLPQASAPRVEASPVPTVPVSTTVPVVPAAPQTLPESELELSKVTCEEALGLAESALATPDVAMKEGDANRLHLYLRYVLETAPAEQGCPEKVRALVKKQDRCGAPLGVVTSAAFSSPKFPLAWTTEILRKASSNCELILLPSVGFVSGVDSALTDAVSAAVAHAKDPAHRSASWLTLGTLEHVARAQGASALVARIDARVSNALSRASGATRLSVLAAAGNGGCVGCTAEILKAMRDADPNVRRTATAALRFQTNAAALQAMCARLRSDENTIVREHTAWALQWSVEHPEARVGCLVKAASTDASSEVRTSTVRALVALAETLPQAEAALRELRDKRFPEDVRRAAWEHAWSSEERVEGERPISITP